MSLFAQNKTPRPYVVTVKLPSGETVLEKGVMAYDMSEALFTVSARFTGRGVKNPVMTDVGPDLEYVEAKAKEDQQNLAATFVAALFKEKDKK